MALLFAKFHGKFEGGRRSVLRGLHHCFGNASFNWFIGRRSAPELAKGDRVYRKKVTMLVLLSASAVLTLLIAVWFAVTQPFFLKPRIKTLATVDGARLEAHVRMLSESFIPRDWTHPENLDRVAAYIHREFEHANGLVTDQPFEMEGKTYRNVIAAFGLDTKERIVVGAHYDAFGEYPAADDNASGVAGLIELAYLLGKTSLPVGVELVAFTLEEPKTENGPDLLTSEFAGSAVHAKALKEQDVQVRVMLSLEMIGYFSHAENSQSYPIPVLRLFYPSVGNCILVVGRLGDGWVTRDVKRAIRASSLLPTCSINAPASMEGIDWSDHYNYWKVGYPAVMVTDTAFYRNKNYHTVRDTPDRLDYKRMAMVVRGVYAAVLSFAEWPCETTQDCSRRLTDLAKRRAYHETGIDCGAGIDWNARRSLGDQDARLSGIR